MDSVEYQETNSVSLIWTVRGLKQLFDSSKGDQKSKVTKSVRFGGGRWQILFYPNSGTEGGGYVSLYLSCEPTQDEKDRATNGRWIREGSYKFSFELRNTARTVVFNQKEAYDHSFSYKTANWGWAQFARRDAVYFGANSVRLHDAFLICCTITSSPAIPTPPPSIPLQNVPKELLDSVGSLLDDPVYSDVVFVLPRPGLYGESKASRKIYAARKLLRRAEYFDSMFNHGFAEATDRYTLAVGKENNEMVDASTTDGSDIITTARHFEDSDAEDEETLAETDLDVESHVEYDSSGNILSGERLAQSSSSAIVPSSAAQGHNEYFEMQISSSEVPVPTEGTFEREDSMPVDSEMVPHEPTDSNNTISGSIKTSQATSSQGAHVSLDSEMTSQIADFELPGPKKVKVVVKDIAYATYRAVLYYLYTDTIVFAPLSSSFYVTSVAKNGGNAESDASQGKAPGDGAGVSGRVAEVGSNTPTSRRIWIKDWETNNPDRIPPCSAKAVYRLADKLCLTDLKDRAFQHIVKSLTVDNIPYEMFSPFSAMFEEVRKVQINFFLDNWNEIRNSDGMRNIWQQIRMGRHPGFEEVWPLIAVNLEFNPRSGDSTGGDQRDETRMEV